MKEKLDAFRALSDPENKCISDAEYSKLVRFVATEAPSMMVSDNPEKAGKKRGPFHILIKGYLGELLKFIDQETIASPDAVGLVLEGIPSWMPLLRAFPESRKKLAERLVAIWSGTPSDQARLASLLALHKAIKLYPKLADRVMSKMLKGYGQACRTLSIHTLGTATFLLNGLVEIFAIEPEKSAVLAEKTVRQLSALLQASVRKPSKESMSKVYCWSFIWTARFLARLVAHAETLPNGAPLKALGSRVLALIHGCLCYNFVPRFYAHHFHLLGAAAELCRATHTYFPAAPFLLTLLQRIVATATKPETAKPKLYDFTTICKVPKSEAGSRSYLDCAAEEALFLLGESLHSHAHLPGFLDIARPIAQQLRTIESINKTWKVAKLCGTVAGKLDQHAKQIAEALSTLPDAAPTKLDPKTILPLAANNDILDQFHKHTQRVREQRRKMVASAINNKTYQEPELDDSDVEVALEATKAEKKKSKKSKDAQEDEPSEPLKKSKKRTAQTVEEEEIADEVRKLLADAKKGKKSRKGSDDLVEEFNLDDF